MKEFVKKEYADAKDVIADAVKENATDVIHVRMDVLITNLSNQKAPMRVGVLCI